MKLVKFWHAKKADSKINGRIGDTEIWYFTHTVQQNFFERKLPAGKNSVLLQIVKLFVRGKPFPRAREYVEILTYLYWDKTFILYISYEEKSRKNEEDGYTVKWSVFMRGKYLFEILTFILGRCLNCFYVEMYFYTRGNVIYKILNFCRRDKAPVSSISDGMGIKNGEEKIMRVSGVLWQQKSREPTHK